MHSQDRQSQNNQWGAGGIDPDVWAALPEEIQLELLAEQYQQQPPSPQPQPVTRPTPIPMKKRQLPDILMHVQQQTPADAWRHSEPSQDEWQIHSTSHPHPDPSHPSSIPWTDPAFPPSAQSIDGIPRTSLPSTATPNQNATTQHTIPNCLCNPPKRAKLAHVNKLNKNHGRPFYTCPTRSCSFFTWAVGIYTPPPKKDTEKTQWNRCSPPLYSLIHPSTTIGTHQNKISQMHLRDYQQPSIYNYQSRDVCQGGIGDCWFMSALAVLADQRQDIIQNCILITQPEHVVQQNQDTRTESTSWDGRYAVRFFLDGKVRVVEVDEYFAISSLEDEKKEIQKRQLFMGHEATVLYPKSNDATLSPLKFAKAYKGQLWVPVIEKAYAKAHGSYQAIHGGQIYEALFDLTGFPTESIFFGGRKFNSEIFWGRLLSFKDHEFLMGAVCPTSGKGLVGSHAYSILDVREIYEDVDTIVGRLVTLDDFFNEEGKNSGKRKIDSISSGPLRLLKIRNPWGRTEWQGDFSNGSIEWTKRLREILNEEPPSKKPISTTSRKTNTKTMNEGIFWISYHDFLQRFMQVDVCYTHRKSFSLNIETVLPCLQAFPSEIHEITVVSPTWIHISLCQRTKRGKAFEDFYYTDISCLVLNTTYSGSETQDPRYCRPTIETLRLFGPSRVSHFDLLLGDDQKPCTYLIIPFSFTRDMMIQSKSQSQSNVANQVVVGNHQCKKHITVVGSGGGGGGHPVERCKSPIEFTIRIISTVQILARPITMDPIFMQKLIWDGIEMGVVDDGIVGRLDMGCPMKIFDDIIDTRLFIRLRVVEAGGISLAHITNPSNETIEIRLSMRPAVKTYTSTKSGEWCRVPPRTDCIVGICVCPCEESLLEYQLVSIEDICVRVLQSDRH